MFVLLLLHTALHTVLALNLTSLENFQVEFDSKCPQFFLLQSKTDYLYFYQKNNQFELWVEQGENYSVYTLPWTESLIFQWPEKIINNDTMNLVLHQGSTTDPVVFDTEFVMCDVKGLTGGTLFYQEAPCETIKCPPSNSWKVNLMTYIIVLLVFSLIGLNVYNVRPDISNLYSQIRRRYTGPETSL